MEGQSQFATVSSRNTVYQPLTVNGPNVANKVERLPFSIRFANREDDLEKAVKIRHSAYARHVPVFAEQLKDPEKKDYEEGVLILLAESKLDGAPLGTMRLQTNVLYPLPLETSVDLPERFSGAVLAQASRLGVTQDRVGRVVKTLLFKAFYMHCLNVGIDWMVIAARSPLDRHYESLMFDDVFPDIGYIPIKHADNIPHRVFAHEIATARERWAESMHPLYDLYFRTHHPDIDVGQQQNLPPFLHDLKVMRRMPHSAAALPS